MEGIKGAKKVFFGKRKSDGANIYLSKPQWDCGWYWGFGYLGNRNEHYHLSSYQNVDHYFKLEDGSHKFISEARNKCIYDCLLEDYELAPRIKENLWKFCELVKSAYALKEAAEVLGRGGSHLCANPVAEVIKSADEVKRINEVVLPAIFNKLSELIEG